jgi:hypothetical protein
LYSVIFIDPNVGYSVGEEGTLLITNNGGTNWISHFSGTTNWLHFVNFTDPNTGYIFGDNGSILKTTDGGGVGFNENFTSANIRKIFPNPVKDKFTLETKDITTDTFLSILNVSGQELLRRQITEQKIQIDITKLPVGVYIIRLMNEKTVEVGKIIKE